MNALHQGLYRKELSKDEVEKVQRVFEEDLTREILIARPVSPASYQKAIELATAHAATLNTRALDVLQVACALTLGARSFYTFDRRQARLADLSGLRVP